MNDRHYHIAIISDQKPRTEVLSEIIRNKFTYIARIPAINSNNLDSVKTTQRPLVLLIDLMGTSKSSREIILPLREIDSEIKLIVMHMYQSPALINPLFKMGIDGYIYYEPSREELVDAILKVAAGETYKPEYLRSA